MTGGGQPEQRGGKKDGRGAVRVPKALLAASVAAVLFAGAGAYHRYHAREPAPVAEAFGDGERLEVIPTRPGVTLPFDLVEAKGAPRACAVLLPGGNGKLSLGEHGIGSAADNVLVRTRRRFAGARFAVAVVDVPSDRPEGLDGFRTSDEHARDLRALVDWMHRERRCAVWLVGTSRGSISAANVVARTGAANVAGIVLTSSVTAGRKESVEDVDLEHVAVPALIVHHRKDACRLSPPSGARDLLDRLRASPRKELRLLRGGEAPGSDPCDPESYHGYWGEDEEVAEIITGWMGAEP
jgi:hypothetical protein